MILENADIKVEYELDELGNVVKSTVSKQELGQLETIPPKKLTKYSYVDKENNINLDYKIITESEFQLKVTGFNAPNNIEWLKLLMWLCEDFIELVEVEGSCLYVYLEEDFLGEGEELDQEILDILSKDFIHNIKDFKQKGSKEFIVNTVRQFNNSSYEEVKALIMYINSALI